MSHTPLCRHRRLPPCRLCALAPSGPRGSHSPPPVLSAPARRPLPCVHLGPALPAPRQPDLKCGCGRKLRQCYLHDTCSSGLPVAGHKCCQAPEGSPHFCPDYEPAEPS